MRSDRSRPGRKHTSHHLIDAHDWRCNTSIRPFGCRRLLNGLRLPHCFCIVSTVMEGVRHAPLAPPSLLGAWASLGGMDGRHHHSEVAAAGAVVDHLLHAGLQVAIGARAPDAMPVQDLWQLPQPCWTMRCSGCRQLFTCRGIDIGPVRTPPVERPTGRGGPVTWSCARRAWRW